MNLQPIAIALLMVGIAGCVGSKNAPTVTFTTNEADDQLVVSSSTSDADWADLAIKVVSCTQEFGRGTIIHLADSSSYVNEEATGSGPNLNEPASGTKCGDPQEVQLADRSTRIEAGEYLSFCAEVEFGSDDPTNVRIRIRDVERNALVADVTFSGIDQCEGYYYRGRSAVRIGFNADETNDRLTVNAVSSSSPTWDRYGIMVTSCTQASPSSVIRFGASSREMVSSQATSNGAPLNSPTASGTACGATSEQRVAETTGVTAGEYLDFCTSPTGNQAASQVVVKIRDREANEIIYEHTFANVAGCAS